MRQGLYNRNRCDIQALQGPDGTTGRVSVPRDCSMVLVSVKSGNVDLWFGEFTGDTPLCPHLHYGQTNEPVWVPIPDGVYTVVYRLEDTISSDPILASLWIVGP